jgi:Zn-dependent peptidase ImmA (M78 family)
MNNIEQWNNLSKHRSVEILGEVYGETLKLPVLIKDVISKYLVDVEIQSRTDFPLGEHASAFSTRDPEIGWLIVLNGNEHILRQRFSAAHELAHIVLVPNEPAIVYHSPAQLYS